jgi:enoyl-CoA hydratase/3-hydroxyacyl-CoA dehydrogenase
LKVEWSNFVKCLTHPVSSGLMNIFFAQRQCSIVPGVTDNKSLKPQKINSVAVIGGGTMGSGIITWLLSNGMPVVLKEVNQKAIEVAKQRIEGNFKLAVKMGKMHPQQIPFVMSKLKCVENYDEFNKVDIVIEAVFEDINLKQSTFVDLEKYTRKDCVLASNTSTISLDVIGAKTNCKERIIGVHFFAPAHVMPLGLLNFTFNSFFS